MVVSTLFGILARIPSVKNLFHCLGMTPSLVISLALLVRAWIPMSENSLTSKIFGGIALPSKTAEDTRRTDRPAEHKEIFLCERFIIFLTTRRLTTDARRLLNLHHFFLFGLAHLFHLLDLVVSQLLDFIHGPLSVVFGNVLVLHRLLDRIVAVTTDVAYRGAMLLEHFVQVFD